MTAEQGRCTSLSELVDTLRAELADATRKQHAAAADANEAGEQLQVWRVQIVVRHHGDHRGMVCVADCAWAVASICFRWACPDNTPAVRSGAPPKSC